MATYKIADCTRNISYPIYHVDAVPLCQVLCSRCCLLQAVYGVSQCSIFCWGLPDTVRVQVLVLMQVAAPIVAPTWSCGIGHEHACMVALCSEALLFSNSLCQPLLPRTLLWQGFVSRIFLLTGCLARFRGLFWHVGCGMAQSRPATRSGCLHGPCQHTIGTVLVIEFNTCWMPWLIRSVQDCISVSMTCSWWLLPPYAWSVSVSFTLLLDWHR
jgi:hypothetical protein